MNPDVSVIQFQNQLEYMKSRLAVLAMSVVAVLVTSCACHPKKAVAAKPIIPGPMTADDIVAVTTAYQRSGRNPDDIIARWGHYGSHFAKLSCGNVRWLLDHGVSQRVIEYISNGNIRIKS